MRPYFNPRHCAIAHGQSNASGGQFPVVSLFNNSTGPYYLAVLDWRSIVTGGSAETYLQVIQGSNSGTLGTTLPVVTDGPTPPGLVYLTQFVSLPTGNYTLWPSVGNNAGAPPWPHDFPLVILPPNWSFNMIEAQANSVLVGSIMWQWCTAEELDFKSDTPTFEY